MEGVARGAPGERSSAAVIERGEDFRGDILAAGAIGHGGRDGPDGAPGNSPPAENQGQYGESQPGLDGAFAAPDEVNSRRPLEGHYQDRDAVLVKDEFAAALQFELEIFRCQAGHAVNPNNAPGEGIGVLCGNGSGPGRGGGRRDGGSGGIAREEGGERHPFGRTFVPDEVSGGET